MPPIFNIDMLRNNMTRHADPSLQRHSKRQYPGAASLVACFALIVWVLL